MSQLHFQIHFSFGRRAVNSNKDLFGTDHFNSFVSLEKCLHANCYSEVVSSSGSLDAENSAGHSIINRMQAYQTEPEELALKQCLELSKVYN